MVIQHETQKYLQANENISSVFWSVNRKPPLSPFWDIGGKGSGNPLKASDVGTPIRTVMPIRILGIEVSESLRSLADEVEKSRWMLELEDDWDGEGSPKYSLETWEQGVSFLLRNASTLWNQERTVIETPKIHNGPNGSIDLYWDASERKLLLNIPPYKKGEITFYAYDTKGNDIKGSLSPHSEPLWLFLWQQGQW